MRHNQQVAVLVGSEPPVVAVRHCEPLADMPTDSGYLVFLADAPDDPDELTDEEIQERMHTVCLHCLIDQHPEAGPGLDLARKHGTVERDPDTGRWHR